VIYVLALLTFLLIPLNIIVNGVFSYRLDPAGFFSEHSGYQYKKKYTGYVLVFFWIHKIGTIFWNLCSISHVLFLTLGGARNRGDRSKVDQNRSCVCLQRSWFQAHANRVHRILGIGVLITSMTSAIAGTVVMFQKDARYDSFTQFFLYLPMIVVYVSVPCIAVDRFLLRRRVRTRLTEQITSFQTVEPRLVMAEMRKEHSSVYHAFFGFLLLLCPLAMMLQFILYSILVAMQNKSDDYKSWKASMFLAMLLGVLSCFSFVFNALFMNTIGERPKLSSAASTASEDDEGGALRHESEKYGSYGSASEALKRDIDPLQSKEQYSAPTAAKGGEVEGVPRNIELENA